MTAQKGISMLLKLAADGSGGTVAGLQTTAFSINNEVVDVTNKDSSGWKTLLQGAGVQSVQLTANGTAVTDSTFTTLRGYAVANSINPFQMVFTGGGHTLSGSFQISKFDVSGAYNKEETFTCTLESSGTISFT